MDFLAESHRFWLGKSESIAKEAEAQCIDGCGLLGFVDNNNKHQ